MTRFDPAALLQKLTFLSGSIPRVRQPTAVETHGAFITGDVCEAMEDFDCQALADSLDSMAADLRASIEERQSALMRDLMRVYYTAESLSRQPEHAHLIAQVEAMRRAYEQDFGVPIPDQDQGAK